MSGIEVLAVVACVAAVCSAYHDGADILRQIRAKRNARKAARMDAFTEDATHELEVSLTRGEDVIQSQYDRDYKRFGAAFANGDDIAKEALKDIIIHLQAQVITNLKAQWQQDTYIDFTALQDVSDSSQDKAILVLMQLQQRIITSGPIENLKPPPLFANPDMVYERSSASQTQRRDAKAEAHEGLRRLSPYDENGHLQYPQQAPFEHNDGWYRRSRSSQSDSIASQYPLPVRAGAPFQQAPSSQHSGTRLSPSQAQVAYRQSSRGYAAEVSGAVSPVSSDGSWSSPPSYQDHRLTPKVETTITSPRNEKSDKGHFASVTKLKLWGTRPKVIPVTVSRNDPPRIEELEAPELPEPAKNRIHSDQTQYRKYPNLQRSKEHPAPPPTPSSGYSMFSETTAAEPIYEPPETPEFNPWADRSLPVTPAATRTPNQASRPSTLRSSGSIRRAPIQMSVTAGASPKTPKEFLPSEENQFQGFCKGAWRAQIGDKKKAMDDRQRPGGMYNAARFWQCSKCNFEGRLLMLDKKTKAVDRRVLTAEGVQFRWDFLFKSHVETKDVTSDFLSATFGCIFCTVEGRGTPTFGGAQMLMAHLQEHRERLPSGEVLYRMNALVGPRASLDEDFDINIVGKEGIDV